MTAVLVTGAAGFIGRHLAAGCVDAGWSVTAVDLRRVDVPGVEPVLGDGAADQILSRIRRAEFDAVLHQAAISDTLEDRQDVLDAANIAMPLELARACAASGTRFVYASSGSVYGSVHRREPVPEDAVGDTRWCTGPLNPYAHSKLHLEQHLAGLSADLPWVGLRYTNVFGPGEEHKGRMASILSQLLRDAAAGRPLTVFSDTLLAARDYLPVGALVDVVVALVDAEVPAAVYNLGAGHAVSFATVLQWCAEFRHDGALTVRLVPNPVKDRYQHWTCADLSRLRAALPMVTYLTGEQVREAAATLYRSFDPAGVPG